MHEQEACRIPDGRRDPYIERILTRAKTIAVVGASAKPDRPAHDVFKFLLQQGRYELFAVNPRYEQVLGVRCYDDLSSIGKHIDIVDVFRRSEQVIPIVREAIELGVGCVWLQQGITNPQAKQMCLEAGIDYVEDRCIHIEYINHFLMQRRPQER